MLWSGEKGKGTPLSELKKKKKKDKKHIGWCSFNIFVLLLEKLDKYAFQTPLDTGPKPGAPVWGKEEGGGGLLGCRCGLLA